MGCLAAVLRHITNEQNIQAKVGQNLKNTCGNDGRLEAARARWPSRTLGRVGTLEVRLAQTAAEVRQAQKLRYQVFYQEGSAIPNPARLLARRDIDGYDAICDHLLVVDHAARDRSAPNRPTVVGTYRLLRQPLAEDFGGFYTAGEFDISALIARHGDLQFLELGRSCVLAPYRKLARDAAMTMKTPDHAYADVWMRRTTESLAALHKEE